jgi:hypothetical protein
MSRSPWTQQDTPIPPANPEVFIRIQGSDETPPPDHEEFKRLRRFSFRGIKKYLEARRKKRT